MPFPHQVMRGQLLLCLALVGLPAAEDWAGPVALARLVEAAQAGHPTNDLIQARLAVARAGELQAGAWDDPTLEGSAGLARTTEGREVPFGLKLMQRLELRGQRAQRVSAARSELAAAEAEGQLLQQQLVQEVCLAAVAYAVAVEAANLAAADVRNTEDILAVTTRRQAAGELDHGEAAQIRAEAALLKAREAGRQREVVTALTVLRTWCGDALPEGLHLDASWEAQAPPAGDHLLTRLEQHPRLLAGQAAIAAATARWNAERQSRMGAVEVGMFGERETDQTVVGLTLGMELPLWHGRSGAIAAAQAERMRAVSAQRAERGRLQRELAAALGDWQSAYQEAGILRSQAVPAASQALQLRQKSYEARETSLGDLLDTRRAGLGVRSALLEARRRAAEARIRLAIAIAGLDLLLPSNP